MQDTVSINQLSDENKCVENVLFNYIEIDQVLLEMSLKLSFELHKDSLSFLGNVFPFLLLP